MPRTKKCATDENCKCFVDAGQLNAGQVNCDDGTCVTQATVKRRKGSSKTKKSKSPETPPAVHSSMHRSGWSPNVSNRLSPSRLSPQQRALANSWARKSINSPTEGNNVSFHRKAAEVAFKKLYDLLMSRNSPTSNCLSFSDYKKIEKECPTIMQVLKNVNTKIISKLDRYQWITISSKKLDQFLKETPKMLEILQESRCFKIINTLRLTIDFIDSHMTVHFRNQRSAY